LLAPLYGSDRYSGRPSGTFTSRLSTGRSPFPLLDITTTATGPPLLAGLSPARMTASFVHLPAAPDVTQRPPRGHHQAPGSGRHRRAAFGAEQLLQGTPQTFPRDTSETSTPSRMASAWSRMSFTSSTAFASAMARRQAGKHVAHPVLVVLVCDCACAIARCTS
jgi:hypothetical protein